MATGSGKTKVMSLALAWSFFHKLYEPDSVLAHNFLVITPNIIVLDRIYKDFQGLRIFFQDSVIPDNGFDRQNWRDNFQLTLHRQDEVRVALERIPAEREHLFREGKHRFRKIPKSVHLEPEWVFILGRNIQQAEVKYDFVCVDREGFKKYAPKSFVSLLDGFRKYKE